MMNEDEISSIVVDSAIEVHRELGPGLLESVYQSCLVHELGVRNIPLSEEVPIAAGYKGLVFETAY